MTLMSRLPHPPLADPPINLTSLHIILEIDYDCGVLASTIF